MNFVVPVLAMAALTALSAGAWWLMSQRPERWASWVNRENDFWRENGLLSPAGAERWKQFAQGRALKSLIALTALAAALGLIVTTTTLVKVLAIEHQKLRQPYNPALVVKPMKKPHP